MLGAAAYAVGALGIVGVGVGIVFGVRALGDRSDAGSKCHGELCTQEGLDLYSASRTAGWISTGGFALGLAGLGAAAPLGEDQGIGERKPGAPA